MKTYAELLKDPRWQKKRLQIFERDNWTCQYCFGTDKTLNVHHMRYADLPWDAKDSWMITLCCDCHGFEEEVCGANPMLKKIAYYSGIPAILQIELIGRTIWDKGVNEAQRIVKQHENQYPEKIFIKENRNGSAKIAQPDLEQSEVEKQSSSS